MTTQRGGWRALLNIPDNQRLIVAARHQTHAIRREGDAAEVRLVPFERRGFLQRPRVPYANCQIVSPRGKPPAVGGPGEARRAEVMAARLALELAGLDVPQVSALIVLAHRRQQ